MMISIGPEDRSIYWNAEDHKPGVRVRRPRKHKHEAGPGMQNLQNHILRRLKALLALGQRLLNADPFEQESIFLLVNRTQMKTQ